jgi:hypothetical protein
MSERKLWLALLGVFILLSASLTYADDKLVFAADLIRHGDRTPVSNIPNAPYTWPLEPGELTPLGMQQEFQLGQTFRKRYVADSHLLPERYDSPTLYVRSTDFNRTLMSAQCVLLGLYPITAANKDLPANFQPIPVHDLPLQYDALLAQDFSKDPLRSLRIKYIYNTKAWRAKEARYKNKLLEWQKITGMKLKSLHSVIPLGDNLKIRRMKNVPLPAGMDDATATEIINLSEQIYTEQSRQPVLSNAFSYPLLKEILTAMQVAVKDQHAVKYLLFSAHDDTLMNVLSALGDPQDKQPPYASDLSFLLYRKDNGPDYFVRLSYNNVPFNIPGCVNDCPLEKFTRFIAAKKIS